MSDTLRNGRGRIRCIAETGYWRDCGNWADRWVYAWSQWTGQNEYMPFCNTCADDLFGEGVTHD